MSTNSEAMKKWRERNPEYARNWYWKNRDSQLTRGKVWRKRNKDRMDYLNKRNYQLNCEKIKASVKEWAMNNPEKKIAHAIFQYRVRKGDITRVEKCSFCGMDNGRIVAHHVDYSLPLEITWLCCSCHKQIHARTLSLAH